MTNRAHGGTPQRLEVQNEHLRAVFVPALGGKMISLTHRPTGHELLLQPPEPERGYRPAQWGAAFEDFDTSGFDECFPTVSACRYPEAPYPEIPLPDHGELWSAPWTWNWKGAAIEMSVRGQALHYTFEKKARAQGSDLVLEYTLTSTARKPFKYVWSSHPLLAAEPGAEILLPAEARELYLNWSRGERLGRPGDTVAWSPDLARLEGPRAGFADKLFTGRLSEGWCALWKPAAGISLTFRFDPAQVPYVGLWICQGGWPERRDAARASEGHFTVALEPCSGRPDALDVAIARGEARSIEPGEEQRWTLTLELRTGRPGA